MDAGARTVLLELALDVGLSWRHALVILHSSAAAWGAGAQQLQQVGEGGEGLSWGPRCWSRGVGTP